MQREIKSDRKLAVGWIDARKPNIYFPTLVLKKRRAIAVVQEAGFRFYVPIKLISQQQFILPDHLITW